MAPVVRVSQEMRTIGAFDFFRRRVTLLVPN